MVKVLQAEAPSGSAASQLAAPEGDCCGASQPAGHDYVIIHGRQPTQLRAMDNQTARISLKVYEDSAAVPDEGTIAATFQHVEHMHSTYMCSPNLAALREHYHRHLPWLASHHRCAVHRVRTTELATLKADTLTYSFL